MPKSIDLISRIFYVYALFRPNGIICYIGKGKGSRIDDHERLARRDANRNCHLLNIIKNAGGTIPKIIIRDNLLETEAFELEEAFIRAVGIERDGGPLVNLTYGGEGPSGAIRSESTRNLLSKITKLRFEEMSEAERQKWAAKQSLAQQARWATLSEEERNRIFEAVSRGNIARWATVTPDEMEAIAERHRQLATDQWAKLTPEEYEAICAQRAETFRQIRAAHTLERKVEIAEAHRQAGLKAWEAPAKRNSASQKSTDQWSDPEMRAFMMAQMKGKKPKDGKWWCTPKGVNYLSVLPRNPEDKPGRKYKLI